MSAEQVNTTAEQFKLITDKKDEPDYKAVSKFVVCRDGTSARKSLSSNILRR